MFLWNGCSSGGSGGCLLITGLVVQSPPPVTMKCSCTTCWHWPWSGRYPVWQLAGIFVYEWWKPWEAFWKLFSIIRLFLCPPGEEWLHDRDRGSGGTRCSSETGLSRNQVGISHTAEQWLSVRTLAMNNLKLQCALLLQTIRIICIKLPFTLKAKVWSHTNSYSIHFCPNSKVSWQFELFSSPVFV